MFLLCSTFYNFIILNIIKEFETLSATQWSKLDQKLAVVKVSQLKNFSCNSSLTANRLNNDNFNGYTVVKTRVI